MHSPLDLGLERISAMRRVAPSGKVATTMILLKWIFETSARSRVVDRVELQAASENRPRAARR